jgi:hypothetical protein
VVAISSQNVEASLDLLAEAAPERRERDQITIGDRPEVGEVNTLGHSATADVTESDPIHRIDLLGVRKRSSARAIL